MKRVLLSFVLLFTITCGAGAQNCIQDSLFYESIAYHGSPASFNKWQKGLKFIVSYDGVLKNEATKLLEYNATPQPVFGGYKNAVPALAFKDKILTLQQTDTIDNKLVLIFKCGTKMYKFLSNESRIEAIALSSLGNVTLFGSMDKMQTLIGKTLYTKGTNWLAIKDRGTVAVVPGVSLRYFPVIITRIEQDKFHQYYVYFRPADSESEYFYIVGYETNPDGNTGEEVCLNRFDTKFSFCNPRDKYKNITEKMWQNIREMKVTEGMTEEEVKLIIDKPDKETEVVDKGKKYKCWSLRSYALEKDYRIYFAKGKVWMVVSSGLYE